MWIAEQKEKAAATRMLEIKKMIEEERQVAELQELQAKHGKSTVVKKVDWMYDGPMAGSEATAEEYLLGKAVEGSAVDEEIGQMSSGAAAGSLFLKKETSANEAFHKLHEDPMLMIKKQQIQARKKITSNPRKMQKLEAQVNEEKERRREKKHAKKEKKKEKKADKKARKKEKKEDKKRVKAGEPPRDRSRSPEERERRDDRGTDRGADRDRGRGGDDRRDRDGDRRDDRDRDRGRDRGRDSGRDRDDRGGGGAPPPRRGGLMPAPQSQQEEKKYKEPERETPAHQKKELKAGYGLQKSKYDEKKKGDYLGPDPAMLKKRRDFIASTEERGNVSEMRKRPRTEVVFSSSQFTSLSLYLRRLSIHCTYKHDHACIFMLSFYHIPFLFWKFTAR